MSAIGPGRQDPRDIVRCACPQLDAGLCAEQRSGRYPFDDDDLRRQEECPCGCHSIEDREDDE